MSKLSNGALHAVFAPVGNLARVDAVVRRLADAIELGLLADGEQLPGESELATRLGVSTVTLREALMALRQQGLVTTRRGRGGGSFVTAPDQPRTARLGHRLADWSTEELRDLADHWAAVAGTAARLAAERTEPEDLSRCSAPWRSSRPPANPPPAAASTAGCMWNSPPPPSRPVSPRRRSVSRRRSER